MVTTFSLCPFLPKDIPWKVPGIVPSPHVTPVGNDSNLNTKHVGGWGLWRTWSSSTWGSAEAVYVKLNTPPRSRVEPAAGAFRAPGQPSLAEAFASPPPHSAAAVRSIADRRPRAGARSRAAKGCNNNLIRGANLL